MGRRPTPGCLPCKLRKKKCDERLPTCGGCERNVLICRWKEGRDASSPDDDTRIALRRSYSSSSASNKIATQDYKSFEIPQILARGVVSSSSTAQLPAQLCPTTTTAAVLSNQESRYLWQHFVHRTSTIVTAKGQSERNPFITILLPIAMSSDLVMQALLSFSGYHYREHDPKQYCLSTDQHYAQALRGLKFGITKFVNGQHEKPLELLLAMLMLSLMEVSSSGFRSPAQLILSLCSSRVATRTETFFTISRRLRLCCSTS